MTTTIDNRKAGVLTYRIIWRWHFYAGLFCIPFILLLSVTGAIYLFKPQVESWQDRAFEGLPIDGLSASPQAQVAAALAAVPGSVLNSYEVPLTPHSAARIIVGQGTRNYRVVLDTQTLRVLQVQNSDDRFMSIIHDLHGTLLIGDRGSMVVELAASWAIVMMLSGLYLWWPRAASGLAGVVYPRLKSGGRLFLRDLHAVIGFWVSVFALFLLVSGLPWAHFWGANLKTVRQWGYPTASPPDWTTGKSSELADRRAMNTPAGEEDIHATHRAMGLMPPLRAAGATATLPAGAMDKLVATLAPLGLTPPVRISPPSKKSKEWTAWSLPANRTQRVKLTLNPVTGAVIKREDFGDKLLLDRIIGIGVSAHEGQLFGWANQVLGVFTTLGLIALSLSGFMMWFKRRPAGALGAPRPLPSSRVSLGLWMLAAVFGLFLPMLGLSGIAVLIVERLVLRRIPRTREFLGLRTA